MVAFYSYNFSTENTIEVAIDNYIIILLPCTHTINLLSGSLEAYTKHCDRLFDSKVTTA